MKSLSLTKPHMIIMVGLPGSGKSFFAEKFAQTFSAPFVCRQKIEELGGVNAEALTDLLLDELLKTRQSIIFEGAGNTRTERMTLAKRAREARYEPLLVWVQVDTPTAKDRRVGTKPGLISPEAFDHIARRFTPPNSAEKPLVISGKHTYASQAKVVLKKLSSPRAESPVHLATPSRQSQPTRRSITIR